MRKAATLQRSGLNPTVDRIAEAAPANNVKQIRHQAFCQLKYIRYNQMLEDSEIDFIYVAIATMCIMNMLKAQGREKRHL